MLTAQAHRTLPHATRPTFYSGNTPPLRTLKHLADWPGTGDQPGIRSGSCISHVLHCLGLVAKKGLTFRPTDSMAGRQAGIVSVVQRGRRFQGAKRRNSPLPMNQRLTRRDAWSIDRCVAYSASTPKKLTGKPLRASNMVELFTGLDLPASPDQSRSGASHRCDRGSPRRRALNEPCQLARPEPRRWICEASFTHQL